ncbi:hypothetical protein GQ55_2G037400 [Panicum hallii var. hallii]|uniref:Uncharacterized protein n=1 Tax=Panicum hallii var. hallii TaxID=1504633 RepID=A0A2T7EL56_9POAL|nr:hypothetical protein GQ55_2G037400 [Panicum hallii var. hallii]PUZ68552.1 hypothetical protein GQ55_2G037400 [Panicum hallii var. hallii]
MLLKLRWSKWQRHGSSRGGFTSGSAQESRRQDGRRRPEDDRPRRAVHGLTASRWLVPGGQEDRRHRITTSSNNCAAAAAAAASLMTKQDGIDMHGADREQPIDATDPIGLEVICRTEHLIPAAFEEPYCLKPECLMSNPE